MAFKRKIINSQKTVGKKLKEARRKQKLTLEQAEETTKVRSKYLAAIEADRWREFPSRVYVLGFVKRYSEYLGLNSREILSEFNREFGSSPQIFTPRSRSEKPVERVIITPRLVIGIFIVIFVAGIIGYIVYSVNKFSKPPQIEITAPTAEIVDKKDIVIEGNTSDTAIVEINSQLVNVDDKGHFSQPVELTPGVNYFEVRSKSRLGEESTKVLKILYELNKVEASLSPTS